MNLNKKPTQESILVSLAIVKHLYKEQKISKCEYERIKKEYIPQINKEYLQEHRTIF